MSSYISAPHTTVPTYIPASEKSVHYLFNLMQDAKLLGAGANWDAFYANVKTSQADGEQHVSQGAVSRRINELKQQVAEQRRTQPVPAPKQAVAIPAGHYALRNSDDHKVYFFQVDKPETGRWAGWTFVKRMSGDNLVRVERTEAAQILRAIEADPVAAVALYGHEKKVCGVCHKRLTDEASRTLGIGPVCIKKFGPEAEWHAYKLADGRREAELERAVYEAEMSGEDF